MSFLQSIQTKHKQTHLTLDQVNSFPPVFFIYVTQLLTEVTLPVVQCCKGNSSPLRLIWGCKCAVRVLAMILQVIFVLPNNVHHPKSLLVVTLPEMPERNSSTECQKDPKTQAFHFPWQGFAVLAYK